MQHFRGVHNTFGCVGWLGRMAAVLGTFRGVHSTFSWRYPGAPGASPLPALCGGVGTASSGTIPALSRDCPGVSVCNFGVHAGTPGHDVPAACIGVRRRRPCAHRVPQQSVPMQVCGSALGRMAAVPRVAIRWRAQGKVCVGPESAAFGFHWRAQRKVCVGLGSAALTRVTVFFFLVS